jgi:recombinational DNA repair protein RecR
MEENGFFHELSVTFDLIAGYTTSGANLTRILLRLLYETREVIIALLIRLDGDAVMQGWHEMVAAD